MDLVEAILLAIEEEDPEEGDEDLCRKTLDSLEPRGASVELAMVLRDLGAIQVSGGRHREAEQAFERAVRVFELVGATHDPVLAELLECSGATLLALGRPEEAEAVLVRALGIGTFAFGTDHPAVARALSLLGAVRLSRGGAGEQLLRRAVELQERAFGDEAPPLARTLNLLGVALVASPETSLAEETFRRALTIAELHGDVELAAAIRANLDRVTPQR